MAPMGPESAEDPRPVGLLVDLESDRPLLSEALARAGYLVARCSTALEAIRRVEQGEARLIMAPLRLAHLTGMELARVARCLYPPLAIILVAGDQDRASPEAAIGAGANALLGRPLRVDAVLSCLSPMARS